MSEGILPPLGENALADAIRAAVGAGAWEEVRVLTPQFERTDGNHPWWFPQSAADLDAIKGAPSAFLRSLGCGLWDDENGVQHWLYPGEWYRHIPAGYEVLTINGEREPFEPGKTDDRRFGCLAYGFTRPTDQ